MKSHNNVINSPAVVLYHNSMAGPKLQRNEMRFMLAGEPKSGNAMVTWRRANNHTEFPEVYMVGTSALGSSKSVTARQHDSIIVSRQQATMLYQLVLSDFLLSMQEPLPDGYNRCKRCAARTSDAICICEHRCRLVCVD